MLKATAPLCKVAPMLMGLFAHCFFFGRMRLSVFRCDCIARSEENFDAGEFRRVAARAEVNFAVIVALPGNGHDAGAILIDLIVNPA